MDRTRATIGVAVAILMLASGCSTLVGDAPSSESPPTTESGSPASSGPPNDVQIARLAGDYPTVNDSGFYYDGSVHATLATNATFEDVVLRLYDEHVVLRLYDERWSPITATGLGTFAQGTQTVSVAVTTTEIPTWIVVEHPAFDDRSVFGGVLVREDGQYVLGERRELDRAPPSRPGECR
ncbi:MAG: hypothetical protein ABEJ86_06585 [Halococcoides sp.]